jgi:hypothetical protein
MRTTTRWLVPASLALLVGCMDQETLLGPEAWYLPASASEPTTTGQEFAIDLTLDPDEDVVEEGTTVTANSVATLGPTGGNSVVYVVDVSGSMRNTGFNPLQPELGDCVGDGQSGSALDAACLGLIALNESLGSSANTAVGLVAFGAGAKTADMSPEAGFQTFTSPPDVDLNENGVPDVEEVIRSLRTQFGGAAIAGIGLFTEDLTSGFALGTYYNDALAAMNALHASRPAEEGRIGFFLSDGLPTGGTFTTGAGSPLQAAVDAGTIIHAFGVGGGAANACSVGAPLRVIADQTGGTCTEVSDPSQLSTILPGTLTRITSVELKVNGTSVATETGSEAFSMELPGVDITGSLQLGMNIVESIATAQDGTQVSVTVEIEVVAAGDPVDPDPVDPVDPVDPDPVLGEAGCTPGYWGNPALRNGVWTDADGYGPSATLASVFTGVHASLADETLRDALRGGGGGGIVGAQRILLRAAVAALLNAQHELVDYPMTATDIITAVDDALGSNHRPTLLQLADELDALNNLGCPIDAFGRLES